MTGTAEHRSSEAVASNVKWQHKMLNKVYGAAGKSPMFCKVVQQRNGRAIQRKQRCIGQSAYKVALAGATKLEIDKLRRQRKDVGMVPMEESSLQPHVIGLSDGGRICIEQYFVALQKECYGRAKEVLMSVNRHKRMCVAVIDDVYPQVLKEIFGCSGPGVETTFSLPVPRKKRGKKPNAVRPLLVEDATADNGTMDDGDNGDNGGDGGDGDE